MHRPVKGTLTGAKSRGGRDGWRAETALGCRDAEAFAGVVDRYRPMVLECCRRLQLPADQVEDVVSETFTKAYEGLPGFKGFSTLGTWLWTIAYRQGVTCLRRHRRQNVDSWGEELNARPSSDPCPAQHAERQEQVGRLLDAMDRLPDPWATAIRLHYWQDQSTARIAEVMKVSDGVVRVYLSRGRSRLRSLLAG
jgi:RNA polymerase sigma factor (sigma-70 family)